MWSMMSVSCGWRSAMRANRETAPTARNMTGSPAFSAARPEPIGGAVEGPASVEGLVERQAHTEHARLLLPCRQQRRRFPVLQRNAAHDSEAIGITLGGFERIVVAVVQARRHDDDAVDTSLVHHWQRALDGEWFRQLRLGTWIQPSPANLVSQMHLGVDDRALACGLRPRLLRARGQRSPATSVVPNLRRVSMMASLLAPLFGGVSSLEDCNLGTAKRNPGPRTFDRGNVRHYRCAGLSAASAPR